MPQIPGGFELILILAVVLLLFGGKKIPQLAKGLGEGIRNFKKSVKEDDTTEVASSEPKKVEGTDAVTEAEAPKTTEKQA
ncbi:MAG: twin-arginine translocase TatA/TatE family subunit [Epsilonproteobacteria bacterium]|nr:MAG: twin-arginine translocase TatA/TatE family subunit [Campylobacterota bacterium]